MSAVRLRPVVLQFDPPTELIAAATMIVLGPNNGRVGRTHMARLAAAAEALPGEGMPSAWYNLVDLSKRWLRDNAQLDIAPRFPGLQPLIDRAVEAGVPAHFAWQDWID